MAGKAHLLVLSLATLLATPLLAQGIPADAGEAQTGDGGSADDAGTSLDAGAVDDAGAANDACTPRCAGDLLLFCDDGRPVALACAFDPDLPDAGHELVGAVEGAAGCGRISATHGDDCLLGLDAPCDPDYADGLSRCDRNQRLFCIGGTCQVADGPEAPELLEPSPGTVLNGSTTGSTTSALSCAGCPNTSAALLGGATLLWRGLRRLRRASSTRLSPHRPGNGP